MCSWLVVFVAMRVVPLVSCVYQAGGRAQVSCVLKFNAAAGGARVSWICWPGVSPLKGLGKSLGPRSCRTLVCLAVPCLPVCMSACFRRLSWCTKTVVFVFSSTSMLSSSRCQSMGTGMPPTLHAHALLFFAFPWTSKAAQQCTDKHFSL